MIIDRWKKLQSYIATRIVLGGVLPNDGYITRVPKCVLNEVSSIGNIGAGLDTLKSFSFPAKTFKNGHDSFTFRLAGIFGINDDNKRIQLSFGGVSLLDTGLLDQDNFGWWLEGMVGIVSDTTFNYLVKASLGQIVTDSVPTLTSSTGALETVRGGLISTLSGGTTFSGDSQSLLLEAESATATDNNIVYTLGRIDLVRNL